MPASLMLRKTAQPRHLADWKLTGQQNLDHAQAHRMRHNPKTLGGFFKLFERNRLYHIPPLAGQIKRGHSSPFISQYIQMFGYVNVFLSRLFPCFLSKIPDSRPRSSFLFSRE
jgi:hypothetical protein